MKQASSSTEVIIDDLWDLIHYRCPLSPLEAKVLLHRYIFAKGESELAAELGIPWRSLNRAAWRLKAKLRAQLGSVIDITGRRY
jgi:DNA-directed RNA polymerase specialized sigma24 family protein